MAIPRTLLRSMQGTTTFALLHLCKLSRHASALPHPPIRLVGDEILSKPSARITDVQSPQIVTQTKDLHNALEEFRRKHGFGRGISAPQIGYGVRMIALNLGKQRAPFTMYNPQFYDRSAEMMTMWDDCMSFPDFLVRVRRHRDLSVTYTDEHGKEVQWEKVGTAVAELLQHEMDHLDGITSFDRAHGVGAVIHRSVYDAQRQRFDAMVDYSIVPTV